MSDPLRGVPDPVGPPRTPLLHPSELDPAQAALHAEITDGPRAAQTLIPLTGPEDRLLGPFALMLLAPQVGSAVQALGAALRTSTELDAQSRELAVLVVAAHERSRFEWLAHQPAALACGLTRTQLQQVLDDAVPSGLDTTKRCVVRTTRALLSDGTLDDEQYLDALRELGRARLAELVWLVGYYRMLATAIAALRPEEG